jgi:uncharacterized protein YgiM (DUF1202 family)
MRRGRSAIQAISIATTIAAIVGLGISVAVPGRAQEDAPARAPAPQAPAEAEASPPPSEQAWVRGEVKTNFRVNPTPNSKPLGVVKTGDSVGVFERRGEWARILVGELTGWIPTSYLDTTPPPTQHVAMLEAQVAELQTKLDAATRDAAESKARIEQLAITDAEREAAMRRMSEENRYLRAGERWPYLVTGAGILGIGLAVGLLLRGGTRRSSSRIRF